MSAEALQLLPGEQQPGGQPSAKQPSAGDRLTWLVDQTARWHRATELRNNGRVMPMEDAQNLALDGVLSRLEDPDAGPKLKAWFHGEQQQRFRDLFAQKLGETGDKKLAFKIADEQEGYKPPIPTMDGDPSLADFDPDKIAKEAQQGHGTFRDYLLEPAKKFVSTSAQAIADPIIGLANLAGAGIDRHDVYNRTNATLRAITGEGFSKYDDLVRQEEAKKAAYEEGNTFGARIAQGAGEMAGTLYGMFRGPGKGVFAASNIATKGLLKNAPRFLQTALSNAAGFAGFNFLAAKGGTGTLAERGHEALIGAAMGTVASVASVIGRGAMRAGLGTERVTGQLANPAWREVFNKWLEKSDLAQFGSETREQFLRRAIGQYAGEGAPGLPFTPRKLFAIGAKSAVEAGAFTAADAAFGKSLYTQALGDDKTDHWERFASNFFGLMFLNAGGRFDLLRDRQRRQETQEPQKLLGAPQEPDAGPRLDRVGQGPQEPAESSRARWEALRKSAEDTSLDPNASDFDREMAKNRLQRAERELQRLPAGQSPAVEAPYTAPDPLLLGWTPEPEAPAAEQGANYTNDLAARDFRATRMQNASGEPREVKVNQNGAAEALRFFPRKSAIYSQLKAIAEGEAPSGTVMVGAADAQHLAANLQRMAPKLRQKLGDEVANPRIQTVDAFVDRVGKAFGLDMQVPTAEKRPAPPDVPPDEGPLGRPVSGAQPKGPVPFEGGPEAPVRPLEGAGEPTDIDEEIAQQSGEQEPQIEGGAVIPRQRVRFQDSPFAYIVEGETVRPNQRLRDVTGFPAEVPREEFMRRIAKATLVNQLTAKVVLPGDSITATEWKADVSGPDADDGVIRTMRFGEVMERPLTPDGDWVPAKPFEPRAPDAIPIQQQRIALDLAELDKAPLEDEDKAVLGASLGVLSTVSAEKDKAVAETVDALQSGALAHALTGSPEQVAKAINVIGEMLTTKAPEVALGELAQQEPQQQKRGPKDASQMPAAAINKELDKLEGQSSKNTTALIEAGLGHTLQSEMPALAEKGHPLATEHQRISRRQQELRYEVERRAGPGMRRLPRGFGPLKREGESGAVLNPVEAVGHVMAFLADNAVTRFIGEGGLARVQRRIGEDMAKQFRKVETNTSRIQSDLQPPIQALSDLPAERPLELTDIHWETVRQGLRYGASGDLVYHEQEWMNHIGWTRSTLSPESQKYVAPVDDWMQGSRTIAHNIGVKVAGKTVAATRQALRLPRHFTAAGSRRAANLDPNLIEALAAIPGNQMTEAQVREALITEGYTDARSLHKADAIEEIRAIKLWPDYLEINGRVERQLETRPLRLLEALTASFSARMGMYQEFGPDASTPTQDPYADVVAKATPNGDDRRMLAAVFREAGGMHGDAHITAAERRFREWLRPLAVINTALKLTGTKSAVQNLLEPLGAAMSMLGGRDVAEAYGEVANAFSTGGFNGLRQLQDQLVQEGGFLRMIHDPNVEKLLGGTVGQTLASVTEAVQKGGRLAMAGFDASQDIVDTTIRVAIGKRVKAMEGNKSDPNGVGFALAMGFPHDEAVRLNSGQGQPEDYNFLLRMGLPHFTNRGDVQMNRTPLKLAAARLQTPFLSYVIKQDGRLQALGAAFHNAKTDAARDAAMAAMLKFMGFTVAQGLLVNAVWELLLGKGWEGLKDMVSDFSSPWGATKEIAYALTTGIAGSIGVGATQALKAMFSGEEHSVAQVVESLGSFLSAPVGLASQLTEFGYSMLEPEADTRYRGYSPSAKVWLLTQNLAPIARDVDRVAARFAGVGLTDVDVQASRTKSMKWQKANDVPHDDFGSPTDFNTFMRSFELEMRKPGALKSLSADSIATQILAHLPAGKDAGDAAASLRARKTLDFMSKLTDAKKAAYTKYMGPARMATLKGYDAMLESIAQAVDPDSLKSYEQIRARERRQSRK
jgi:hypothetical protein